MSLVDDWRHGSAMVEVYADRRGGDGFVILFERYAPERAAKITNVTRSPRITWLEGYTGRNDSWKRDLSAEIRSRLSAWA